MDKFEIKGLRQQCRFLQIGLHPYISADLIVILSIMLCYHLVEASNVHVCLLIIDIYCRNHVIESITWFQISW